jgi:2-dehydro-3-deoxygluconokinase
MVKVITYGEIMGRMMLPVHLKFRQALPGLIEMKFAGAEANVAASIAILGGSSLFVTALPKNEISTACLTFLRSVGIDTSHVLEKEEGRLGLYFTETGANQRPSRVIYDRSISTFALTEFDEYNWKSIFDGASWLHVTGISPALSKNAADAVIQAVRQAKANQMTVSCDLNFRKNLWKWEPGKTPKQLAGTIMRQILPSVDILIANEEDASDVLDIHPENTDVNQGQLDAGKYEDVARRIVSEFPAISMVATTLRESVSANHNNWGAMLYDAKMNQSYFAPCSNGIYQPFRIANIVDRVGGGDAFAAGLIFALTTPELKAPEMALAFAVASSCLAHSIHGDFNYSTRSDVEALMNGQSCGRIVR